MDFLFQEQRDKIRADAVNQIPIAIQYDIGQSSNFNFPTYSMDEFQGIVFVYSV